MDEERIFKPDEYPIDIEIYDAFLKFEMEQYGYRLYGSNPEDWHDWYLIFVAGYGACIDTIKEFMKKAKEEN